MAQSSDRPPVSETHSEKSNDGSHEWHAPTLTFLGSIDELTLGSGNTLIDGPFNAPA